MSGNWAQRLWICEKSLAMETLRENEILTNNLIWQLPNFSIMVMLIFWCWTFILCVCWAGTQTDILRKHWRSRESKNIPHPKMNAIHYSWTENFTFAQFIYLFPSNLNSQIKVSSVTELLLNLSQGCKTLRKGSIFSIMFTQVSFPLVIMWNLHCGQRRSPPSQSNPNVDIVHDGFPIQR